MLPMHPLKGEWRRPDLRNHRKILVVDGTVAFTGSQNLIEPGYNKPKNHEAGREWVELVARVEGPVVSALNVLFATDWYSETDDEARPRRSRRSTPAAGSVAAQVMPSGPGFATENNLRLFTAADLLRAAPALDHQSLLRPGRVAAVRRDHGCPAWRRGRALRERGRRPVHGLPRAALLLRGAAAGRRPDLPLPRAGVLHSKYFTVDDDVAVIGSSNMDMRSFGLNYEVSLMMPDPEIVSRLREVEDDYRALSRELTLEEWLTRSRGSAYVDNVMRLTAALQ